MEAGLTPSPHRYDTSSSYQRDLPLMQRNISSGFFTRHPAPLAAAVLDNACLSVSIHGILILFLCLH